MSTRLITHPTLSRPTKPPGSREEMSALLRENLKAGPRQGMGSPAYRRGNCFSQKPFPVCMWTGVGHGRNMGET